MVGLEEVKLANVESIRFECLWMRILQAKPEIRNNELETLKFMEKKETDKLAAVEHQRVDDREAGKLLELAST